MSPFQLKLAPFVTTSIAAIVQGQPTPGIVTTSILAVFTFKALRPGLATIGINPNAQVLANDGQGTNVLRFVRSARVEVWDKIE